MKQVGTLTLTEPIGVARKREWFRLGVPLAKGLVGRDDNLALTTADGQVTPVQFSPSSHWDDGSVRWALVSAPADLAAGESRVLALMRQDSADAPTPASDFEYHERDSIVTLANSRVKIRSPAGTEALFEWCTAEQDDQPDHTVRLNLRSERGAIRVRTESASLDPHSGPLTSSLIIAGTASADFFSIPLCIECRLTLSSESDRLDLELSIHNPEAARHPDGQWDLGDEGSFVFNECSLDIAGTFTSVDYQLGANAAFRTQSTAMGFTLYQEGSGRKHWNSRNHVNTQGLVPLRLPGYEVRSGDRCLERGSRAEPALVLRGPGGPLSLVAYRFWQNCPASLVVTADSLNVGLFPAEFPDAFELQGGESKRQQLTLMHSDKPDRIAAIRAPMQVRVPVEDYRLADAFPAFAQGDTASLDRLIQAGIDGEHSFFNKRELADEYGWRHFGDIFADHENRAGSDDPPVMSHYNNQYDPLYGFARQYALTGDRRWFDLMDDLARHVIDIDIYKTHRDKADYNGGLFWHTDHYLDAATCTHRTYSRHHEAVYEDYQPGGGPGGEHCYTTGLMYHYLLTGHLPSREAVLTLTDWISHFYEGSGSVTERFLGFLRVDLPHLKREPEGKQLAQFRYPLDRGVGNYLTALMDSYILTSDHDFVACAGSVIRGTVHPEEDLDKRRLDRVELAWFYSIFLQAVARYLCLKESMGELDDDFHYARAAFLHYIKWMLAHEYVYLSRPEKLEFPNHTWTAQELRKANLFYYAAYFSNTRKTDYLERARQFYRGAYTTLEHQPERTQARVLSILMQNHGPAALCDCGLAETTVWSEGLAFDQAPAYSRQRILSGFLRDVAVRTLRLSPRRELCWLAQRSAAVSGLLSRLGFHFHRGSPKC